MATTIQGAALTGYADLAREIGLDPLRMLDRVGIPRAALSDPDMRISAAALRDLWELCAQTAEDWGLRLRDRSFHDILQEARLGLAFQYLEESDRPVLEVAELLGFSALAPSCAGAAPTAASRRASAATPRGRASPRRDDPRQPNAPATGRRGAG